MPAGYVFARDPSSSAMYVLKLRSRSGYMAQEHGVWQAQGRGIWFVKLHDGTCVVVVAPLCAIERVSGDTAASLYACSLWWRKLLRATLCWHLPACTRGSCVVDNLLSM